MKRGDVYVFLFLCMLWFVGLWYASSLASDIRDNIQQWQDDLKIQQQQMDSLRNL